MSFLENISFESKGFLLLILLNMVCCLYLYAQQNDLQAPLKDFYDSTLLANQKITYSWISFDTPLNLNTSSPFGSPNSHRKKFLNDGKIQVQMLSAYRKLENPNHTFSQTLWTQTNVTSDIDIKGIPVHFNYNTLSNDKLNLNDAKSASISFDIKKYTQKLKKDAIKKIEGERKKYLATYFPEDIDVTDSLKEFESLKQQMKNLKANDSLIYYQNKIQKLKDNAQSPANADTLMHSPYEKKANEYQKLKERYQRLYGIKKKYVSLEDSLAPQLKKFEKMKQEVQKTSNPSDLKSILRQNNIQAEASSWMDKVRQFSLGNANVDHSEFTSLGFYFNGFLGEYTFKQYPLLIAFGYQNPYAKRFLGGSIPSFNGNKQYAAIRVGHINEGLGEKYIMLQRVKDRQQFNSASAVERTNTVLSFLEREKLNRTFSLESEQAISWSDFDNVISDFDLENSFHNGNDWNNVSASIGLNAEIEEYNTTCGAKFRHVGETFVTLANPFLISNSQAIQIMAAHQLLKQKIILRNEWSRENIFPGSYSQSIIRSVFSSNLTARVSNNIILNFLFSPIRQRIKNNEAHNEQMVRINRWSATANIFHSVFHRSIAHTISYLNFNTELPEEESETQNIYTLTEIQLTDATFLNGQFHSNFVHLANLPEDMHCELMVDFAIGKQGRIGVGTTYDNSPLTNEKYGLKAEANFLLLKSLTWRMTSNYRNAPNQLFNIIKGDLFFQTSVTYGIPLSISKLFNSKNPKR